MIFVHIPRTGGTTIAQALGLATLQEQHKPLSAYESHDGAWTIVRNPYDRAVSLCAFLFRETLHRTARTLSRDEFTAWLKAGRQDSSGRDPILYQDKPYAIPVWAPMVEFTSPDIQAYRFEALRTSWTQLCLDVGVSVRDYPPTYFEYASRRDPSWRHYYADSVETKRLVASMYAADFDAFGYSTEI